MQFHAVGGVKGIHDFAIRTHPFEHKAAQLLVVVTVGFDIGQENRRLGVNRTSREVDLDAPQLILQAATLFRTDIAGHFARFEQRAQATGQTGGEIVALVGVELTQDGHGGDAVAHGGAGDRVALLQQGDDRPFQRVAQFPDCRVELHLFVKAGQSNVPRVARPHLHRRVAVDVVENDVVVGACLADTASGLGDTHLPGQVALAIVENVTQAAN